MDANQNIRERRSIRKYRADAVTAEDLQKIVETAAYAPSWTNSQTASYLAVLNKEKKEAIAEKVASMVSPRNGENIRSAAAVVLLLSENGKSGIRSATGKPLHEGLDQHWQSFDAGIAAQTFCLAAHAYGLGTLIIGGFDEEGVKSVISIPENHRIAALLAVGYPENQPAAPKRKSVEELLKIEE